jgi:hypothetical protein
MGLHNIVAKLPGVDLFLSGIIGDCYNNKAVLVVIPPIVDISEIESLLLEKSYEAGMKGEALNIYDVQDIDMPVCAVCQRLGIDFLVNNKAMTIGNILTTEKIPECLFLFGLYDVDDDLKSKWFDFFNNWNKAVVPTKSNQVSQKPAICMFVKGPDLLNATIAETPQLEVRYWHGVPSALEVRLYCRLIGEYNYNQNFRAKWQEFMIPALAINDLTLVEELWDVVLSSFDDIKNYFSGDAQKRGWSKEQLKKWDIESYMNSEKNGLQFTKIRNDYACLLANGIVNTTLEYGVDIHSSALAAIEEYELLIKRLWRGQISLILPIIDSIRLYLCDIFTEEHGEGWPLFFPPGDPEEVEQVKTNPRACQLGHLCHTMQNDQRFYRQRKFLTLAKKARHIRNELSHYRAISFSEFRLLMNEVSKLSIRV